MGKLCVKDGASKVGEKDGACEGEKLLTPLLSSSKRSPVGLQTGSSAASSLLIGNTGVCSSKDGSSQSGSSKENISSPEDGMGK